MQFRLTVDDKDARAECISVGAFSAFAHLDHVASLRIMFKGHRSIGHFHSSEIRRFELIRDLSKSF
jgi:hypothetical protein